MKLLNQPICKLMLFYMMFSWATANLHHYRAMIETLLSYSNETKESHLAIGGRGDYLKRYSICTGKLGNENIGVVISK